MIKIACFGFVKFAELTDKFFQAVWTVIRKLNLQPLLTVAVAWLVTVALGGSSVTALTVFVILAGIAAAYAVAATAYNFVRFLKEAPARKARERNVKDIPDDGKTENGPVYYRVAQNPRYVMAEYPDRFELYFDNEGDLELIKVTLKNREERTADDGNLQ
ncbi:MAG: hypothetical protein J6Z34_00180 [Clostridia bacterium]|nr:hypothetical protein [Clostridia bacterium]